MRGCRVQARDEKASLEVTSGLPRHSDSFHRNPLGSVLSFGDNVHLVFADANLGFPGATRNTDRKT